MFLFLLQSGRQVAYSPNIQTITYDLLFMITNLGFPVEIDFLEKLKSHSAAAHKKLESLSVSASILCPDIKIAEYCFYLSLMYDVHKNTEEIIFPVLNTIIADLQQRKKTHLIENDLLYLKYKKHETSLIFKDIHLTTAFCLGILYVVEGSSLGGRYILKNVEKAQALNHQKGVSYFTGYANQTGSYWKLFTKLLQEYEQQYNCADQIIAGAVYAFDCIYSHFQNTVQDEN